MTETCGTCKGAGLVPPQHVGMSYTQPDQPCPDCDGKGTLKPAKPAPAARDDA